MFRLLITMCFDILLKPTLPPQFSITILLFIEALIPNFYNKKKIIEIALSFVCLGTTHFTKIQISKNTHSLSLYIYVAYDTTFCQGEVACCPCAIHLFPQE